MKHLEKAREIIPTAGPMAFNLALAHSLAGNIGEAKTAAANLMKWYPDFTLDRIAELMPFKYPDDVELIIKEIQPALTSARVVSIYHP